VHEKMRRRLTNPVAPSVMTSQDLRLEEAENMEHLQHHQPEVLEAVRHLNTSQRGAVSGFLMGSQKLHLTQGPPGTGKSHTIATLLRALVATGLPKGRLILVAATSNKAVQCLLKKFLWEMQGLGGRQPFNAKVVLAGVADQLPPESAEDVDGDDPPALSALDVFVHEPVHAALARVDALRAKVKKHGSKSAFAAALTELVKRLTACSASLDKQLGVVRAGLQKGQTLLELVDMMGERLRNLTGRETQKIETEMFESADLCFCTLATAGRSKLQQQLKQRRVFCAIVDEAAQAVEGETLLVLPYFPQRLLLVGDPQQLSATVVSEGGKQRLWDRSLMQRLWEIDESWPVLQRRVQRCPVGDADKTLVIV
jgi:superfamily I DNA and/or RNA helicase